MVEDLSVWPLRSRAQDELGAGRSSRSLVGLNPRGRYYADASPRFPVGESDVKRPVSNGIDTNLVTVAVAPLSRYRTGIGIKFECDDVSRLASSRGLQ